MLDLFLQFVMAVASAAAVGSVAAVASAAAVGSVAAVAAVASNRYQN